jgi:hypothetical protein
MASTSNVVDLSTEIGDMPIVKKVDWGAMYNELVKKQGSKIAAPFWKDYNIIKTYDKQTGEVNGLKMLCKACDFPCTYSNPSQSANSHTKACKGSKKRKLDPVTGLHDTLVQASFDRYTVQPENAKAAVKHLARYFFTNNVALCQIEDPHLKAAFQCLGATLPGRTALGSTMIAKEYSDVQAAVALQMMKYLIVYIATDGWKRKFAEHGTPIINVMILIPLGGSIFHKVVASGGECKNTQWVVDLHMKAKSEVEALYPHVKVGGFVMDNTKANTAAMKQMGEADHGLVNVGCVAHALALLFKDVGKKSPQWILNVYKKCLDISNVVNGAQHLNQLLHDYDNVLFAFELTIKYNVKKRWGRHECYNTILWVYEGTCGKGVAQSHHFLGMLH